MSLKDQVQAKVQKAKEDIVINLMNESTFYFIIKWLFTNRVSVLLFILLVIAAGSYYHVRNEYLYERNKILIDQNNELLATTANLKEKVKQFELALEVARESFKDSLEKANKLSDPQKKAMILNLIERLKKQRKGDTVIFLAELSKKLKLEGAIQDEDRY